MHTVVETLAFLRQAQEAGMSGAQREDLVEYLARNPTAGEVIQDTGGCRKLRVAGRGKGKSGGFRVITFYTGMGIPIFLLGAFSKGERSDLSQAERNALAVKTKELATAYRKRRKPVRR